MARRLLACVVLAGLLLTSQPALAAEQHVVRRGETLWSIARSYDVRVRDLAAANGIRDPSRVRAGMELTIPDSPGASTTGGAANPQVRRRVGALLRDTAVAYGWRPAVPQGVAMVESGWNNGVVSARGAIGIMQILPATEAWLEDHIVNRELDLNNPADNVEAGIAYLDWLYGHLGRDVDLTLAAYYEGYNRVRQNGPSAAARHYAATVRAVAEDF